MKIAIIFFMLGVVQGVLVCDWYKSRKSLKQALCASESKLVAYAPPKKVKVQ